MTVSELKKMLENFDDDAIVTIFNDTEKTDCATDIVDIDYDKPNDTDFKGQVMLFMEL